MSHPQLKFRFDAPEDWWEVAAYEFDPDAEAARPHHYLGIKEPRLCRFCGRGVPHVTFRKDAHVIPFALGNRHFRHWEECDSCNANGGRLEDALCSMLAVGRVFSRVHGRGGPPKLRVGDSQSHIRAEANSDRILVFREAQEDSIETWWIQCGVHYRFRCPPYRPMLALKAIARMGLFLADSADLARVKHVTSWVNGDSVWEPVRFFRAFIPGPGLVKVRLALHCHAVSGHYRVTLTFNNDVLVLHLPDASGSVLDPPVLPYLPFSPYEPHLPQWHGMQVARDGTVRDGFEEMDVHVPALAAAPPLTDDEIRLAAYFLFLDRLRLGTPGDARGDWLAAEQKCFAARAARAGVKFRDELHDPSMLQLRT